MLMQMAATDGEQLQHREAEDDDGLDELTRVVARLLGRMGGAEGLWTLELQYANGAYLRGFVKHGPIGADDMRTLLAAGGR